MKNKSYFILSIDFELIWGGFFLKNKYHQNILNEKKVVTKLLELFKKNNISATWACVGLLFYENLNQIKNECKFLNINYQKKDLSNYNFLNNLQHINKNYYLASEIISNINSVSEQEIASHTFSHFYTLEKGQLLKDFQIDVKMMDKIAKSNNLNFKSIIFPRNQINENYFQTLYNSNIRVYRGKLENFFIKFLSFLKLKRLNRYLYYLDSHFNIMGSRNFKIRNNNILMNIPESFFIYPNNNNSILSYLRIKRIKRSMTNAAINNQCIHLWFHPHNFSKNIELNFLYFQEILHHYKYLNKKYNMQSINMSNLYEECKIKK